MLHCVQCDSTHRPGSLNRYHKAHEKITSTPDSCDKDCTETACTDSCSCKTCLNRRFFWSPPLLWNSPDYLRKHRESMYANGVGSVRARSGLTVNYEMCTPRRLRRLVKRRGLIDPFPQGITLSYYYIKLLEAADRSPPVFRFLDLPPEARNIVYNELLTIDDRSPEFGGHCYPEALTTCHQIHDEASDLPYASNYVHLLIHADECRESNGENPAKKLFKTVWIQNHGVRDVEWTNIEEVPNGIAAWPHFLRRVHKMQLEINLIQGRRDRGAKGFVKNCLLTLVAFLMGSHCLEDLIVIVNFTICAGPTPNETLQPLHRLKIRGKILILHQTQKTWELMKDMQNPETIYPNILKEIIVLLDKVKVLSDNHELKKTWSSAIFVDFAKDFCGPESGFSVLLDMLRCEAGDSGIYDEMIVYQVAKWHERFDKLNDLALHHSATTSARVEASGGSWESCCVERPSS